MRSLTFGLGRLHHILSAAVRRRLLRAVLDAGFSAFDVAPAYGNGLNEAELGRVLAGSRAAYRITTKYGIPIRLYGPWAGPVFPLVRLIAIAAAAVSGSPYARRNFDTRALERSVEGSLRRLRTDYIDRLLMHEPLTPLDESERGELCITVERLKREGKIREFGVAGSAASIGYVRESVPIDVVQLPLSDALSISPRRERVAAYGVYRHYRASGQSAERDFVSYLRRLIDANPGLDLIVTSLSPEVVASYARALGT